MANTRLTIVVRKDLHLPVGLLVAQCCHMSDSFMRKAIERADPTTCLQDMFTQEEIDWTKDPYLSVLGVESYEELRHTEKLCDQNNVPYRVWENVIPTTSFEGTDLKFRIGISIGPEDFDKIKLVTSPLKLY